MLKIVGRKKEIIVTAGGKNVIPGIAENHLRTSPLVSQAMLVGDEKPFIAALVTLDPDTLSEQLEHLGLPRSLSIPEAAVHPAVRAAVQRIVDEANQLVSRAEGIREFRIMNRDLTEEDGYLTPLAQDSPCEGAAGFLLLCGRNVRPGHRHHVGFAVPSAGLRRRADGAACGAA